MAGDRNGSRPVTVRESDEERDCKRKIPEKPNDIDPLGSEEEAKRRKESKRKRTRTDSSSGSDSESESESEDERKRSGKRKSDRRSRRRKSRDDDDESDSESEYSSEYSDSEESDEDRKKRKRKDRKKRDKEEERRRRRKKEKRRIRKEKEEEKERRRRKRKKERREKKKEKMEKGKKGAVTNSWGKYGIIRETDMWNKRPEFTAWLLEVKKVNLESLPAWEEKQMFKDFMEDHNTATFPSKKYYNIDAYYKHQMEKEWRKGMKKVTQNERTVFNDEEQRRLEMQQAREKQKEEEVQALKLSMQSGMAQAMRDQARLREEMAYLFKIGNTEAAAAIQKRLDPDVPM